MSKLLSFMRIYSTTSINCLKMEINGNLKSLETLNISSIRQVEGDATETNQCSAKTKKRRVIKLIQCISVWMFVLCKD